jgi:recombination DNA repair RAD52 pathway protein
MSEIEKTILNVLENDTIEQKYSWEDIMTMFDGYSHFDKEQLKYVYHHLNNHEEKAKYYLEICLNKSQKLIEQSKKMKITSVDDKISVEI